MSLWHADMKTEGVIGKLLLLALAHDSSDRGAMLPWTLCEAQHVLEHIFGPEASRRAPRYKNRPGFPYGFPVTEIQLIKSVRKGGPCPHSQLWDLTSWLVSEPVPSETRSSLRISGQYWIKFIQLHLVADSPSTDAGVYNLHLISPSFIPPPRNTRGNKTRKGQKGWRSPTCVWQLGTWQSDSCSKPFLQRSAWPQVNCTTASPLLRNS